VTAPLRVGTRRSPLALRQTQGVADALAATLHRPVEILGVTTRGDVDDAPLASIGGAGVFVSALRDALLDGEVDLAVHSLKDLPTAPAAGLALAAVPERADARDVLVGVGTDRLLPGTRVSTGSPRRAAALLAMRRGVVPVAIRGNIDTRLGMVVDGHLDAVVLAAAALARLGRELAAEPVDPSVMLPAPGQGALAVESRTDVPDDVAAALAALDHPDSRAAVSAERAALSALEAGCSAPVGALAHVADGKLTLDVRVWSLDGRQVVSGCGHDAAVRAEQLGDSLAGDLLARGAAALIPAQQPKQQPKQQPELKETAL
jgi:hydroxymethylbilane synthase